MKGISKVSLQSLLFVCAVVLLTNGVYGQSKCVPGVITSVNFTSNYTLQWPAALNPNNCTIATYVIYLTDLDEGALQLYETSNALAGTNAFDFWTLNMCSGYSYSVMAKTNEHVLGGGNTGVFTTPPKSGISLNISIDHTITENSSINIKWEMEQTNASKCVSYYRLVLWNETNEPTDIYLETTNYTLENVIPCTQYEFQVRAIIVNPEIEGPFTLVSDASAATPTSAPKLHSIATTSSSASMVWELEAYGSNKCEITALVIETLLRETVTIPIADDTNRNLVTANLTNLTADTVYTSNVYVVNSAGNSTKVTVTYQTTGNTTVATDSMSLSAWWSKINKLF